MILKDLIKKYELISDDENLVSLNVEWFLDNDFNLGKVCDFVNKLKSYLIEGFNGIYDFVGDYDNFIYSIDFYKNLFWILYELDFDFLYRKIISYLDDCVEIIRENDDDWDKVEEKLDYIKYELVSSIK